MKEIEIVPLARKKMVRRGIPERWVIEALTSPDQIVEGYGGRMVAHKRHRILGKDRLLQVVFEETLEEYVVITAYLTSDVRRYWKEKR